MSAGGDRDFECVVYEENGRVAATFWEWRHKTMSHFLAVLAGLIALATWAFDNRLDGFAFAAFLLGSLFALGSYFLNRRTRQILEWCYAVGASIEAAWRPEPRKPIQVPGGPDVLPAPGPYHPLATELAPPVYGRRATPTSRWRASTEMTYGRTMGALYLTSAVLMLTGGIVFEFVLDPPPPEGAAESPADGEAAGARGSPP
jgi:hypothetical protein